MVSSLNMKIWLPADDWADQGVGQIDCQRTVAHLFAELLFLPMVVE